MKRRQPYGPGFEHGIFSLEMMVIGARRAKPARDDEQLAGPVTEQELAAFIRDVASGRDRFMWSERLLEAIASALDGKDGLYLKLHRRRGQTLLEREERLARDNEIAALVWRDLNDFGSMEAAVSAACAQFDLSRQTVFDALKNLAQFYRGQGRPSQVREAEREAVRESGGSQYGQYLRWLDRYLDEPPTDEG